MMSLYESRPGDHLLIKSLRLDGAMLRRLLDLGFVPGAVVKNVQRSPMGDPVAYQVSRTTVALRKEESSQIDCQKVKGEINHE
ncbi:ferrous iron transport protein A [Halobacillus sp. A5]|uniref:FeoA family protein n=1 Tax=Halobacillus sp. A5 TaxID=2880263 RepID=UPI0035325030